MIILTKFITMKVIEIKRIYVFILMCSMIICLFFVTRMENFNEKNECPNFTYLDSKFERWLQTSSPLFHHLSHRIKAIPIEGHIFQLKGKRLERKPQLEAYYNYIMENKENINRFCEIGFNGGHSALMWATLFDGRVPITSFDICKDKRCDSSEQVIRELFPNLNLTLIRGDSRHTVLEYAKGNPNIRCDFISIDGGHFGDTPGKDIENMQYLASKRHVVVMDDVNPNADLIWIKTPGLAWERAVQSKLICQIDECKSAYDFQDFKIPIRYCFGRYCHSSKKFNEDV